MCGRFFVDAKNREIDRLLEALPPNGPPVKLGDIYPTNPALVLTQQKDLPQPEVMTWGFPAPGGKGVIFNARAESALVKPFFANSLRTRPVAIPVNGFYEWQAVQGQKHKDKYFFFAEDTDIIYLAGFWKYFSDKSDGSCAYFTILTTMANESISPYHNRMPILLHMSEVPAWLKGESLFSMLSRMPFALHAEKVGT